MNRPLLRQIEHVLQKRDFPVDRCRTRDLHPLDLVTLDGERTDVRQLHRPKRCVQVNHYLSVPEPRALVGLRIFHILLPELGKRNVDRSGVFPPLGFGHPQGDEFLRLPFVFGPGAALRPASRRIVMTPIRECMSRRAKTSLPRCLQRRRSRHSETVPSAGRSAAVGMPVARHPPHRSVRAELPHTAPILDE
jgi:hypothetical protein